MLLESLSLSVDVVQIINALSKFITKNNSTKNMLLSELKQNLISFNNAHKSKMDFDSLIKILLNKKLEKVLETYFIFNIIKFGSIKDKHIKDKRNKRYKGKDCRWLFENISLRINELKNIQKYHQSFYNVKGLNITLKFSNLFYKMKLLSDFITIK